MWSPGAVHVRRMASSAAIPLENARPNPASSSEARQRGGGVGVGLAVRGYAWRRWWPPPAWGSVGGWKRGAAPAPVVGSGAWPAWMARVSKPNRRVSWRRMGLEHGPLDEE